MAHISHTRRELQRLTLVVLDDLVVLVAERQSDRGDVAAPRMERAHHQSIAEQIGDVWSQRDVVLIACEPAAAREIVLGDVWPEVGVSVEGIGQSAREGGYRGEE